MLFSKPSKMSLSYHYYLGERVTPIYNSSNFSSQHYFRIKLFYIRLHSFSNPALGCRIIDSDNVNILVPREQLISPESGPAIIQEIFVRRRIGAVFPEFLDTAATDALDFARERAADERNAGRSVFTLEINVLAASSSNNGGDDQHFYQAVREWTEERARRVFMEDEAVYGVIREFVVDGTMNRGLVPATRDSVGALEKVTYEGLRRSELEDQCGVCLEDFSERGEKGFLRMPCSHVFHQDCILQWLQASHTCPLCRYALPSTDQI